MKHDTKQDEIPDSLTGMLKLETLVTIYLSLGMNTFPGRM